MAVKPEREEVDDRGRAEPHGGLVALAMIALGEFEQLTGLAPERVTGAKQQEGGWSLLVDVVELERVPPTTSVMATYRLDIDGAGSLVGYERVHRFTRAATD